MTALRRIVLLVIFAGLLWAGWGFAHGNGGPVQIDYLLGQTGELALWKALVGAAGLGVLLTGTVLGFSLLRARLEARRFRKAMLNLESEVHQLRNLPLESDANAGTSPVPVIASGRAVESA